MNILGIFTRTGTPATVAPVETVKPLEQFRRAARRLLPKYDASRMEATKTRGFDAANMNNLTADWFAPTVNINGLLAEQLPLMRARCRERMRNDDYAKGFARIFVENVVGPNGIRLQALSRDEDGQRDIKAASAIEKQWNLWAKYKANCDMAGRNNWRDQLAMISRMYVTDGEIFLRMITGPDAGPYGFRVQLIDPSLCDSRLNQKANNGNLIRLGVEVDQWNKPIAYYFSVEDRSPNGWIAQNGTTYIRIEASEIIHQFISEFPDQIRGIPPMAVSLGRLRMLGGYETAALTNARASAAKMGFYYRDGTAEDPATAVDENGQLVEEITPGQFSILPKGYRFEKFDSDYPNGEIAVFKKSMLRAIATGLGVDYPTLGNDLEAVNLASARVAINETRELWKGIQQTMVDNIVTPVFESWLKQALIRKKIMVMGRPLMIVSEEKYQDVRWMPRRWAWPDPVKDASQATTMINNRIKAPSTVAGDLGIDWDNELQQIAKDEEMLKLLGLTRLPDTIPPDSYIADNYIKDENGNMIPNDE